LAPVQLTSFGHPDTTGIPNMDYFVSSENYETGDAQQHYSERLVTLPNAGTLAYYHRPTPPDVAPARERFGLSAADRIYLCPQSLFKIHPEMDDIFLGILEKDESAKIVLIEMVQKELRTALEQRMQKTLRGYMQRVSFVESLPYDQFLGLIQCADVMLDTLHFNGQNTSLEAFSLGTPVVTMPGQLQRERHTYGMYRAMNFMGLVAATKSEYVEKAVHIATDPEFRRHCKNRIAESCGVLFENAEFVRNCEKMFLHMVQQRISARSS
jgi:predicted O-linked N-acetylglucosamine transferase (SPINDLY family)